MGLLTKFCQLKLRPYCNFYVTLGVKIKVEFKLSIPIGVIVEISLKGFTLGDKVEIFYYYFFNLPFYGPNLT
jgi:hypothetical protein